MSYRGRAVALLFIMVLTVVAPAMESLAACGETGQADCCQLEGSVCVCCVHGPRMALFQTPLGPSHEGGQPLDTDRLISPQEVLPQDISHVPRISPLS